MFCFSILANRGPVFLVEALDGDVLQLGQPAHDDLGHVFDVIVTMKEIHLTIQLFH